MAFDDLARHMAARDKKKLASNTTAEQLVADMAIADRRMERTRNLVLGPILLLGGLIIGALYVLYVLDAVDIAPHPKREEGDFWVLWYGAPVFIGGMVVVGARQLYRGLRGR